MVKPLHEIRATQTKIFTHVAGDKVRAHNLRAIFETPSSLRLTAQGAGVLKKVWRSWNVESPGMTAGNLMILQSKMTQPYYINKKILVLFDEKDAFWAKLAGSKGWLNNKE